MEHVLLKVVSQQSQVETLVDFRGLCVVYQNINSVWCADGFGETLSFSSIFVIVTGSCQDEFWVLQTFYFWQLFWVLREQKYIHCMPWTGWGTKILEWEVGTYKFWRNILMVMVTVIFIGAMGNRRELKSIFKCFWKRIIFKYLAENMFGLPTYL